MKTVLLFFTFTFFSSVLTRRLPLWSQNPVQGHYRLSGDVKPTFYSLKIHPNLDTETFTGEATIHITIESSVKSIEFHSSNLDITSLFFDTEEVLYNPCFCNFNFAFEYANFELIRIFRNNKNLIPPGSHIIHIKYRGEFSDTTEGLFKSGINKNGTILSYLLATDFQPTKARQVFPCFDEPSFKARYQLDVLVPNSTFVALSNMRALVTNLCLVQSSAKKASRYPVLFYDYHIGSFSLRNTVPTIKNLLKKFLQDVFNTSDGIVYKFEPTPLMSIYLLSFVVTQHSYTEYVDENLIPYRMYCCHAREENNTELLEYASRVIQFYTNYTNVAYPLPKIDLVEYDRQETAATENWGLVTFNTSLLCSETDFYDMYQKQAVLTHELAHFWFGNLVTNSWWDDIWLQESLATFMATKAQQHILQNKNVDVYSDLYQENLFWLEMNNISTPVVHFQEDPVKIRQNFNEITYIKGSTVLSMTEMVIGGEKMRDVLRDYVKRYAYKTASSSDFISVVSKISDDVNVREFMETFLYQSRFPVVSVDEEEGFYVLTQKTFVPKVLNDTPSAYGYKWTIPITYITDANNKSSMVWFHKDAETLKIAKNDTTWIKLNYKKTSYYRTNYSDNLWQALRTNLMGLEPSERNHLALEAWSFFELGLRSCNVLLEYIWNLSDVTNCEPALVWTLYWKLGEEVEVYDEEAALKLKEFFRQILLKSGRKHTAERFASNAIPYKSKKKAKRATVQIESCIHWIHTETPKFYSNSTGDKIDLDLE